MNGARRLSYTALCEVCSTVMHKALGRDLLPALEAKCAVTIKHAIARIDKTTVACSNVDSKQEAAGHGKTPSKK